MKNRFNTYFPPLFVFGETILLIVLFFGAHFVAYSSFRLNGTMALSLGICAFIWVILSLFTRDYKIGRAVGFYYTFKKAFTSVFLFVSIISLLWVFVENNQIDRHFLISFILLLFVWVSIYRTTVHLVLDRYRTFGGNIRKSVIIGYDELGFNLYNLIQKRPQFGIRVKGFLSLNGEKERLEYPLLGDLSLIKSNELSELDFIYISDKISTEVKNSIVNFADENLIKVKLLPDIKLDVLKSIVLRRYEHVSVIDLNHLPLDSLLNRVFKRAFDLIFSLVVIVGIMSWLYPLIAILIKLDSKGPVIFKQNRHGENNSIFSCYKFRTMHKNDEADEKWATVDDYRITRIGQFLRRSSIDELPQIFNVFLGHMSVVGPRPHPIKLNEAYQNKVQKFANRHSFKPGITGLAQSMGYRGEISQFHQMNSRVRLDRFYLQNWSFVLDIKIIVMTVVSLYRGQEYAY